jgi:thymidylate synthase (FAD)
MRIELIQKPADPIGIMNAAAMQCHLKGFALDHAEGDGKISWGGDDPDYAKERIARILKSRHFSILEHVSYTFAVEGISRCCANQLVRHRRGKYSQQSQRHVDFSDLLPGDFIAPKSIREDKKILGDYHKALKAIMDLYNAFSAAHPGLKAEECRYLLPSAAPVNIIFTMDARALKDFFNERLCSKAQEEIRTLAERMREMLIRECWIFAEDQFGPKCLLERASKCPMRCFN